jgi:hypothetical protein
MNYKLYDQMVSVQPDDHAVQLYCCASQPYDASTGVMLYCYTA